MPAIIAIEQTDNGWVITYMEPTLRKVVVTDWNEVLSRLNEHFGWTSLDHSPTKDPHEIRDN